jgi:hypothetical protein
MHRFRFALVAAAIASVAIVGYSLFPRIIGSGGRSSPTPFSEASRGPTFSSTPISSGYEPPEAPIGLLSGGTYRVSGFSPTPWALTVPPNWSRTADGIVGLGDWTIGGIGITTWSISDVYGNMCHWRGNLIQTGTPDALAQALAGPRGFLLLGGPTEFTLGSTPTIHLTFVVPWGTGFIGCDDDMLRFWPDPGPDETGGVRGYPGVLTDVYIVRGTADPPVVVVTFRNFDLRPQAHVLDSVMKTFHFQP